jgi:hypothetical protein
MLRRECELLVTNADQYYIWSRHWDDASRKFDYSALPPALATLQPREIIRDPDVPNIVRIELFGMHHTGGTDNPYYFLWVVRGAMPTNYTPAAPHEGLARSIGKVADGIFEVYQLQDR